VIHEKLLLQITVNQKNEAERKIDEATRAISARVPETWCHLLVPYQNGPGPHGAEWDEKKLSGGKGSLTERASKKCNDEDWLLENLGTLKIRQKLDAFLWRDRPHVQVRELADWCRRYLPLPRISTDQVLLDALVRVEAALRGEETFHLADDVDASTGRYSGLRPQQASSNQLPTLNSLVVKNEVALAQVEAAEPPSTASGLEATTSAGPSITTPHAGAVTGAAGDAVDPFPITPLKPPLPTHFVASVKLDSTRAGLQVSTFMEEVMSHFQVLGGVDVEMTLEVQVNAPGGIDQQTARIELENSAALTKVENRD